MVIGGGGHFPTGTYINMSIGCGDWVGPPPRADNMSIGCGDWMGHSPTGAVKIIRV